MNNHITSATMIALVLSGVLATACGLRDGFLGAGRKRVLVQTDLEGRAHLEVTSGSVSVKTVAVESQTPTTRFTALEFRVLSGSANPNPDQAAPQAIKQTLRVNSPVPAPFLSVGTVRSLDKDIKQGDRWEITVTCENGAILHGNGVFPAR